MGFGNSAQKLFFKIKNGKIVINIKEADSDKYQNYIDIAKSTNTFVNKAGVKVIDIQFNNFEGYLQKIELVENEYNGNKIKQWAVHFIDNEGKNYIWNTYYNSQLIQGFVNCLLSIEGPLGLIKIFAYEKNDKTRIAVYNNGDKLSWKYEPKEIPVLEKIMVMDPKTKKQVEYIDKKTGKVQLDDSQRMGFFEKLIEEINQNITEQNDVLTATKVEEPSY